MAKEESGETTGLEFAKKNGFKNVSDYLDWLKRIEFQLESNKHWNGEFGLYHDFYDFRNKVRLS